MTCLKQNTSGKVGIQIQVHKYDLNRQCWIIKNSNHQLFSDAPDQHTDHDTTKYCLALFTNPFKHCSKLGVLNTCACTILHLRKRKQNEVHMNDKWWSFFAQHMKWSVCWQCVHTCQEVWVGSHSEVFQTCCSLRWSKNNMPGESSQQVDPPPP